MIGPASSFSRCCRQGLISVVGLAFVVSAAFPAAGQGFPPGFGDRGACQDLSASPCWSDGSCVTSHTAYMDAFSQASASGGDCGLLWMYEAASRGSGVAAALLAVMFASPGYSYFADDWESAVVWARAALAPDRLWFSLSSGEIAGEGYYSTDTELSGLMLPTVALRPLSLYRAADVLAAAYDRGFGGLEPDPVLAFDYYEFAETVARSPVDLGRYYPALVSTSSTVLDDGFTRSLVMLDRAVEGLCWAYPLAVPEACSRR